MSAMSRISRQLARVASIALVLASAPALAQVAPNLGSLGPFAVVSSTYTNTVAGTTLNGNLCFTTGPVVAPTVTGSVGPCPVAAGPDQIAATGVLTGQACTPIIGPLEGVVIGALPPGTFPPGCYTSVGALNISANGIVNLLGNGVFVFRSTGGAITTGANSVVNLSGSACAGNVFWTAPGLTTLGGTSTFAGTILDAAGVTLGLGANLTGRALAFPATVTTNGANTITVPGACAALAAPTVTIAKVSNFPNTFGFTGTNGIAAQGITTVTPNVAVSGPTQTLTTAGVSTSITEGVPPAGYTLTAIACSGLGAGGTALSNLATRTVTLDAAATVAGSLITCTFTNNFAGLPAATIPTLSEWAMILLAGLLAIAGFVTLRRRENRL